MCIGFNNDYRLVFPTRALISLWATMNAVVYKVVLICQAVVLFRKAKIHNKLYNWNCFSCQSLIEHSKNTKTLYNKGGLGAICMTIFIDKNFKNPLYVHVV